VKNNVKKILFVFGTIPEAIKFAPVINAARASNNFKVSICVTAQHREILDQVLNVFNIIPDYDLNIMVSNQSLFYSTSHILIALENIIKKELPDLVICKEIQQLHLLRHCQRFTWVLKWVI
jgi:UDP-N-acetylglucosamine 2-epimerase (non-hydrolysing)